MRNFLPISDIKTIKTLAALTFYRQDAHGAFPCQGNTSRTMNRQAPDPPIRSPGFSTGLERVGIISKEIRPGPLRERALRSEHAVDRQGHQTRMKSIKEMCKKRVVSRPGIVATVYAVLVRFWGVSAVH